VQFLSLLALVRGQDLAIDTAGRALLMLFALAGGGLFWWLLAPGRVWSPRGGVVEPVRLRQALRFALATLLLLILGLTLKGYVFTAGVLVRCLWQTGGVLLGVSLLHGLVSRWFLLGERRLALQRAEERREAARADAADCNDGELPVEAEVEQLDIQSIGAQTQRLVRALSATVLVLLLFWVWAEILPALQRLDEIALWSFSDKAADGSAIVAYVSLQAALIGAAALLLTVIAARNLPGLLEIGLLNRVSLDAPTRYAISTLARYAIVILGVLLGLSFLGMRWSQLQWMAAALTVGLGFGLQEIFANFVSGLILLFERPFRVGDIITIGEFTGRVTRIRTRATTILDFDNKEVVIPNKAFITDRLTNWTLSDSTTRLIIKVGVAYGSDVQKVHALLLQAAAECPHITRDPPARTWLLAFGASSLDFELRVFVPSIELRLLAQSDLHGRVATLLGEEGIEIAFPQMDLHVRDLPAAAAPAGFPAGSGQTPAPSP
jgi:potassium-dependent mechanosensitive channel